VKQETASGSGINWAICKSAPRSGHITTPAPHRSVFLEAGCPSCTRLVTNYYIGHSLSALRTRRPNDNDILKTSGQYDAGRDNYRPGLTLTLLTLTGKTNFRHVCTNSVPFACRNTHTANDVTFKDQCRINVLPDL